MKAETMLPVLWHEEIPDDEAFIDEMLACLDAVVLPRLYQPLPEKKKWFFGKTVWRTVSSVFFYGALVLALLAALVFTGDPGDVKNLVGFSYFTVMTPSMQSVIPVGSLIITRRTDAHALQIGDVITYFSANTTVTHRIVDILYQDGIEFQTKGDDNHSVDPDPVSVERVIGRVVFHVRYIGHAMLFMQQRIVWVLGIFLLLIALSFTLQQLLRKEEEEAGETPKKTVSNPGFPDLGLG